MHEMDSKYQKKIHKLEKKLAFANGKLKGKGGKGKGKIGKSGWNQGRGWNTWTNDGTNNKSEKTNLPAYAKPEHMKKFYDDDQWEKRLEILENEESPKKYPELFKLDRWNNKYVCFNCRETGHTMDRCFQL